MCLSVLNRSEHRRQHFVFRELYSCVPSASYMESKHDSGDLFSSDSMNYDTDYFCGNRCSGECERADMYQLPASPASTTRYLWNSRKESLGLSNEFHLCVAWRSLFCEWWKLVSNLHNCPINIADGASFYSVVMPQMPPHIWNCSNTLSLKSIGNYLHRPLIQYHST